MDQTEREKKIYLAKLAEQAERYDGKSTEDAARLGYNRQSLLRYAGGKAFDKSAAILSANPSERISQLRVPCKKRAVKRRRETY